MGIARRACALAATILLLASHPVLGKRAKDADDAQPEPEPLVDEAEQRQRDQALAKELVLVEQAQAQRLLNATLKVHSWIVAEAPNATLWSGDGDLSTTGACERDITWYCRKVKPGEGRLAGCLTDQLEAEAAGDDAQERPRVLKACREELAAFKADRATNVNKNVPLAFACRRDIRRHCRPKKVGSEPGAIMDCLRERRHKLSGKCAALVFAEEEETAKDLRLDVQLQEACAHAIDTEGVCGDVDPEQEGSATQCLIEHRAQVGALCQEQLERWEVQRADDVRLDRHLFWACSAEMRSGGCKGAKHGEGRMEQCLQDQRYRDDFSERCRRAVEARMERESADYQLNFGLREHCAEDIEELCEQQADQIALAEGYGADSQVIGCLETQRDRIRSKRCREEVHRQMQHEAEDLRFDHELAKACHSDVKLLCGDVVPGSARVIHCLQHRRDRLEEKCSQQLFQHEVMLAEDIDFKFPLRKACLVELDLFCGGVPHGHARAVRCLHDNLEDPEMSLECRDEIQQDDFATSMNYRLNYRLRGACAADVTSLCAEAKALCASEKQCQGGVLDCLRSKQDEIKGEECRNEVFSALQMQVADIRNDPQTEAACAKDAPKLCPRVRPYRGLMHACLQRNMDKLSPKCREREVQLSILQAGDVRLQPALVAVCSEEMNLFCGDVEPGKGRMQQCLTQSMGRSGFSAECRHELSARMLAAQQDYRLDYGVATACQVDTQALCGEEEAGAGQPGGPSGVVACLVDKYQLVAEPCQNELNRFVRLALWNYRKGSGMTAVCDADVQARCPALAKNRGMYRAGVVGKCLAKQVAQGHSLSQGCRRLVMVAVPRDVRSLFDRGMSLEAVAGKVARIAHSAGLSAMLVDPQARGMHSITVSGWVAAACVGALVLVLLGMVCFALWRCVCSGGRHSYTPVGTNLKEGDV
ncbi:hypothetical protein D9Q98_006614 [Chlorella vulgaris]|uniref:Golgi apparatus protein 1 n=1 Tax=Chlorella vulgaris TaxID=3077 RepID=A0A9D4YVE8_CHLVU|nr:hypothetical protein D9Q98_006614 [Chlorella vulgaris]